MNCSGWVLAHPTRRIAAACLFSYPVYISGVLTVVLLSDVTPSSLVDKIVTVCYPKCW